jgi:hypothetical protein
MRSLLVAVLLALAVPPASTPVGRFRLATVDGVRVPMVWRQGEDSEGGAVQLHWVSGRAEFRKNGSFDLAVTALRSGAGLAGEPENTTMRGTWRVMPGFRIELRFPDGRTTTWGPSGRFATLTLQARYPDLEGRLSLATLVMVRE